MFSGRAEYDGHELVTARLERGSGLSAIIAVHNTWRGPAIGGCRIHPYRSEDEALADVLRLARGMTYKTAIAEIPYGGGKAVVVGDPHVIKTRELLLAMGDFVDSLGGRYITSFDSGTTLEDVGTIGERTRFAAGTHPAAGNASESTAEGVYQCLLVGIRAKLGRAEVAGLRVAIQGLGNVGRRLADRLAREGAKLILADPDSARTAEVAADTGGEIVAVDDIVAADAEVFAPCAMGAVLSEATIPRLKARVVCGGANNQLATAADDERLREAGILYCPDFLANAGGIINLHYQLSNWSQASVDRHVKGLGDTFAKVIEAASASGRGTGAEADAIAEQRFGRSAGIVQ